jgi:hypothetical protein
MLEPPVSPSVFAARGSTSAEGRGLGGEPPGVSDAAMLPAGAVAELSVPAIVVGLGDAFTSVVRPGVGTGCGMAVGRGDATGVAPGVCGFGAGVGATVG